jgi:excinuclease ABC subunit C
MTEAEKLDPFDASVFLKQVTSRPGVYCMLNAEGETLYVGKAKNLKLRVSSYFKGKGLDSKTLAMVSQIANIDVFITSSEMEALLLEHNLIKDRKPAYNIMLRDDKSYPYIYLSNQDEFPRFDLHRGAKKGVGQYFGPFPSAGAVRESLSLLQKVFKVRQCDDSIFRNRSRPCLQYQIKRCSAPCVNFISTENYASDVRHSVYFLEGRNDTITDELQAKMQQAAEGMDYESAATLRDQIRDLRRVLEQQYVDADRGDVDVLAVLEENGLVIVNLMMVRQGRILGSRNFFPSFSLDATLSERLGSFMIQYYLNDVSGPALPKEIICSVEPADHEALCEALEKVAGRRLNVSHKVRTHRKKWLQMSQTNAQHALLSKLNSKQTVAKRLNTLQEVLGLEKLLRLECFDISHTGGEATVASCVVFDPSGPLKSDYRRFNIEGIQPGDDYAAMYQALKRRYQRVLKGEATMPDVLVIDGGLGQLQQAERVLKELGMVNEGNIVSDQTHQNTGYKAAVAELKAPLLLAVAKGISRKAGQETLFLGGSHMELVLAAESPAMHLLQHIRDEAHRFAITAHRDRRTAARTRSTLDDVPGIGPKKRKELLKHFGGLKQLKAARVEELERVQGVSAQLAQTLYDYLHSS